MIAPRGAPFRARVPENDGLLLVALGAALWLAGHLHYRALRGVWKSTLVERLCLAVARTPVGKPRALRANLRTGLLAPSQRDRFIGVQVQRVGVSVVDAGSRRPDRCRHRRRGPPTLLAADLGCELTGLFAQLREEVALAVGDLVVEERPLGLIQFGQEPEAGAHPLAELLRIARQIAGNQP